MVIADWRWSREVPCAGVLPKKRKENVAQHPPSSVTAIPGRAGFGHDQRLARRSKARRAGKAAGPDRGSCATFPWVRIVDRGGLIVKAINDMELINCESLIRQLSKRGLQMVCVQSGKSCGASRLVRDELAPSPLPLSRWERGKRNLGFALLRHD